MLNELIRDLKRVASPEKATVHARFFKTGKGEYGEGDVFLGVKVPEQRKVAKKYYKGVALDDLEELLQNKFHECRLTALFVLVLKYQKGGENEKDLIVDLYLRNTRNINNWDLVDSSAPHILGDYLLGRDRKVLYKLAMSKNLWERRIAILATQKFIRVGDFDDTLKIAEILLNDEHDLIHKAVGWMLRELGQKDRKLEEKFLKKHMRVMPRTMLRYAIEKFTREERDFYLGRK